MSSPISKTLRLERLFDATPQQLWAAWTDPAQYAQWLNPAPGLDLVIHEFDVRPGGRMRFDMPQPDGNPHPQEGVFHELKPYTDIVSGSEDKSFLLHARFVPESNGTRLVIDVTGVPPEWHEPATAGWGAGFDKLAALLDRRRERPDSQRLDLERVLDAPVELVWAAFTNAEAYAKWISPFPGLDAEVHDLDPRVSGRVRFTMVDPNGHRFPEERGVFETYHPPREIVQYQSNEGRTDAFAGHPMRMRTVFEPLGDKTRIRFTVTGLPAAFNKDWAGAGFNACLDKLAAALPGVAARGFTVERTFPASPEKVWVMFTSKAIESWWGPADITSTVEKQDVRPGGRYAIRMRNDALDLVNHGTYVDVQPARHLSMIWRFDIMLAPGQTPYDVPISVDLHPVAGGTRVVFKQGPLASEEWTRGSEDGVKQNFERLAKALESARAG